MRYLLDEGVPITWPMPSAYFDAERGARTYEAGMTELRLLQDIGFDWVSFSEHHFSRTLTPSPIVAATHAAAMLPKMKIALLGPNMLLSNPVRVAEELAMLDQFSQGRVIAGLLRGTANEYQVNDINPGETREIAMEAMELIMKAWSEPEPFSWQGRHFQFRTVSVWPRPFQQPAPPIYVLGGSHETSEFAAKHHTGIGVAYGPFEAVSGASHYYQECCRDEGWEPDRDRIIYRGNVLIAKTDEEAQEQLNDYWHNYGALYPMRFSVHEAVLKAAPGGLTRTIDPKMFERPLSVTFAGSPETIVEKIRQCREQVGAGVIDMTIVADSPEPAKILRSIELFGEKVLPRIRDI